MGSKKARTDKSKKSKAAPHYSKRSKNEGLCYSLCKELERSRGITEKCLHKERCPSSYQERERRLRAREREEKEKPDNAGVNIVYDWKRRVLLRDGVIIDRYSPRFF